MGKDTLLTTLQTRLARQPGVELAILFGSRARGTARPDSDLDLGVVGTGLDLIALSAELEVECRVEVDLTDLSVAPFPLLQAMLRDGVCVYERFPGGHARFVSATLADLETDLPNLRMMQRAFVQRLAAQGIAGVR